MTVSRTGIWPLNLPRREPKLHFSGHRLCFWLNGDDEIDDKTINPRYRQSPAQICSASAGFRTTMTTDNSQPSYPIGVSCPGGIARQYRVQTAAPEAPAAWQLAGSFRDATTAYHCAKQLAELGQHTRIIACRNLPTAA
jgi:hypothetical protein